MYIIALILNQQKLRNDSLGGLGGTVGYLRVEQDGTYDITFDLTECRYLYFIMQFNNGSHLQPTMIPLSYLSRNRANYISYNDGRTYCYFCYSISDDNKLTIGNKTGENFKYILMCGVK